MLETSGGCIDIQRTLGDAQLGQPVHGLAEFRTRLHAEHLRHLQTAEKRCWIIQIRLTFAQVDESRRRLSNIVRQKPVTRTQPRHKRLQVLHRATSGATSSKLPKPPVRKRSQIRHHQLGNLT